MPRLVDVEALKLPDEYQIGPFDGPYYRGIGNGWNSALQACREHIDSTPTVSPDEVRGVGEWEDAKQHGLCRCSVCKDCYIEKDYITQAKWKYCPNCGAMMEVSEDG